MKCRNLNEIEPNMQIKKKNKKKKKKQKKKEKKKKKKKKVENKKKKFLWKIVLLAFVWLNMQILT